MEGIFILVIALIIDIAVKELPNRYHPVAWLGKAICRGLSWAPKAVKAQLLYGAGIVLVMLGLVTVLVYSSLFNLRQINMVAYILIAAFLLKLSFSFRGLATAADGVKEFLARDKLNEARLQLQSLVSRDTTNLDEDHLVSATVESVAENSCDSFVAPLFYFLLLGVPGAVAYRIVNTFDTMIGYHGEWEYLGKFAARLDDVVNFLPARFTALMIVIAAWLCQKDISGAWRVMLRDHNKTPSPNAGWTMSAAAGALGVQLEKIGHYKLGDNHYPLSPETISASLQIMAVAALVWSLASILVEVVRFVVTT
ncbi:MAG: cobalamin biosynthesis protein [Dehalococcoidales bacterium]|nr:cobalamin biosynthesis protein [Dehalococcoidales bacterium]